MWADYPGSVLCRQSNPGSSAGYRCSHPHTMHCNSRAVKTPIPDLFPQTAIRIIADFFPLRSEIRAVLDSLDCTKVLLWHAGYRRGATHIPCIAIGCYVTRLAELYVLHCERSTSMPSTYHALQRPTSMSPGCPLGYTAQAWSRMRSQHARACTRTHEDCGRRARILAGFRPDFFQQTAVRINPDFTAPRHGAHGF